LPDVPAAAVLTLNGFNYDDAPIFHKQVFRELAQQDIRYLVIDLRQNPGGNLAYSNDLLGYLRDTTFAQVNEMWATLRHPEKPSFYPYFNEQTKKLLLANTTFARAASGKYYFNTDNVGPQKLHAENRFRGKIYVLTGGFTFSAGSLLAASLKGLPNVTVIGQETGGGQAGCSGGIIQLLTLPHTGLRVKFPQFRIVSASKDPNTGHGVYPDYPITYTFQDKAGRKDLELEKVINLIRNSSGAE
jgi:C-terminal processing protease CtpA/Prc